MSLPRKITFSYSIANLNLTVLDRVSDVGGCLCANEGQRLNFDEFLCIKTREMT